MQTKLFLLISILGFYNPIYATDGFACSQDPRDTRIQVILTADEVNVKILNPSGYSFMPQFEGPVSQFLIPSLKMQTDDLAALGDIAEFVWPRTKCKMREMSDFTVDCEGPALRSSAPGIVAQSLSTTLVDERSARSTVQKVKYRFVLEKSNFYFVGLLFPASSCFTLARSAGR